MTKLYMYSIFHGNLNYSSIPPESYETIIDSCYWPVLDILQQYKFKTGIEFPVETLEKIHEIDPLFIDEIKRLISKEKCELICSGKEQVVFPLVPEDVNRFNLSFGKNKLEEIFSMKCNTAYINEQMFSSGLIPLYSNLGFENIILVYEWANKFTKFDSKNKFFPKKISSKAGSLNVIWNSYIAYQKFQRYVNGEIPKEEYFTYLQNNKSRGKNCFPLYASDFEIFGYKNPVLGLKGDGKEIDRFHDILNLIETDKELDFILPSKIVDEFPPSESIKMNSARFAILGKKQDKFIVTRWATCGRDNSASNTICYKILKKIRILKEITKENENELLSKLIDCWASDYRTHTTESKYHHFNYLTKILDNELDKEIAVVKEKIISENSGDLIILNPNDCDWEKIPYEIKMHFQPRIIFTDIATYAEGMEIPSQIEDKSFYKDGSLRSCTLILEPIIQKKSILSITLRKKNNKKKFKQTPSEKIETPNVELSLLKRKGSSISELRFPKISKNPLVGFLEHGTFSDTKLSADYFSGHMVAFDRNGNKFTDLVYAEPYTTKGSYPIRNKITTSMELPLGHLTKTYYAYTNHPRIDVRYSFTFREFRPASFRIGIFTLKPESFSKQSLNYSTHNGGNLETFGLDTESITQDESSDPRLTNQGCLGSTEGLVDFGDNKMGVTLYSDKSLWYSVPMINYHQIGDSFFYRMSNSVSELDDTTMTWWKGKKDISFSLLGRKNNLSKNIKTCKMMFLGLVCVSGNKDIWVIN